MPSQEEREAQPVLEGACPKCGSPVVLRFWEGRHYAKCKNKGCFFGFDADDRGNPAARCPACGTGRLRTTSKGRVCADCDAWESPKAKEAPAKAAAKSSSGLGPCPKCGKGTLSMRTGAYGPFVSCSERCGLIYGCDAEGAPEGGTCKSCGGPVKKTQSGSRVCAVCGTWQEERKPAASTAPGRPKDAACPRCRQTMKTVFTRRQKWAYRCDACEAWYDA